MRNSLLSAEFRVDFANRTILIHQTYHRKIWKEVNLSASGILTQIRPPFRVGELLGSF